MASVISAGTTSTTALNLSGDTTGVLQLQTNGTTAAMTIDTSQNVGIGTSSPGSKLHVEGANVVSTVKASSGYAAQILNAATSNVSLIGFQANAVDQARIIGDTSTLQFCTGSSNTERMRIDSSGNVGIGITPSAWGTNTALQIHSASFWGVTGALTFASVGANYYWDGLTYRYRSTDVATDYFQSNGIHAWRNAVSGIAGNPIAFAERMRITSSGALLVGTTASAYTISGRGVIELNGSSDSLMAWKRNDVGYFYIHNNSSGVDVYQSNNLPIIFYTNSGQCGRFTGGKYFKATSTGTYYDANGGYHELRGSTDGGNLAVYTHTSATNPYGPYMQFTATAPNNGSNYFYYFADNFAARCVIYSNGNIVNVNGSYGTISDIKNKDNIVDATPKLDKVMQLKVRNFNLKQNPDLKQIGFVAQEFEQVFPSMVEETADNGSDGKPNGETTKAIKTTVLIPILVKAMQEQQAQIEELKQEVAKLKGV